VKVFILFEHYSFDYAPSVLVGNYSCLLIYILFFAYKLSLLLCCELKQDNYELQSNNCHIMIIKG